MPDRLVFDAHTHLFNASYLVRELVAMGWHHLVHDHARPLPARSTLAPPDPQVGTELQAILKNVVQWASETRRSLVAPPSEHLETVREATSSLASGEVATIPLGMDIFYMFHQDQAAGSGGPPSPRPSASERPERFESFGRALAKVLLPGRAEGRAVGSDDESLLRWFRDAVDSVEKATFEEAGADPDVCVSPGFRSHALELIALERDNRGRVFPFFPVDPRRPGIYDIVTRGAGITDDGKPLVSPAGPFYGVKLYTRLGYKPSDPRLLDVLRYCSDKCVPVTVHASPLGFPPGKAWRYASYANPADWREVLLREDCRELKVNFAHFGQIPGASTWPWADQIEEMMKDDQLAPRVFADIACFTSESDHRMVLDRYRRSSAIRECLMYGSDYDVMGVSMFPGSLEPLSRYVKQTKNIWGEVDGAMDRMAIQNPLRFLGIASAQ